MLRRYELARLRKQEKLEREARGEFCEDIDDASLISKWHHNTNIQASDELLVRLRKYHKDLDHD